jgi:hypothetical protein
MESRQHREISRIPVAEIREIPWSHYDYVKLCFSSSLKVSLFFRIFRMLYAWDMRGICDETKQAHWLLSQWS